MTTPRRRARGLICTRNRIFFNGRGVPASDWLFGHPQRFVFSSEPALPFKIPVASLSRFVTFPFGYLMKTRVIGKRSDWSRWWSELEFAREPMMRVKKPKTPSDFEWLAGCWFFSREEINTLSHAFRDGAPHFSTHARNLLREP